MPTISTGFAGGQSFTGMPGVISQLLQGGFLVREMEEGLDSILAYRRMAIQETFPGRIGESMTRTRKGRLAPVTDPINAQYGGSPPIPTSALLDNGLSVSAYSIEQYTMILNEYAGTQDLNLMAEQAQIADQFIANARNNGVQAAQSLERICRLKLFGCYLSGNTRVIAAPANSILGTPTANAATITNTNTGVVNVDDVRGFQFVINNGQLASVSGSLPQAITIVTTAGAVITGCQVEAAAPYAATGGTQPAYVSGKGPSDITSTPQVQASALYVAGSSPAAPSYGMPGLLTIRNNSGSTYTINAGDSIIANDAPQIFRPFNRPSMAQLIGTDVLTMSIIEDATAYLRDNGVPPMDDGTYHCVLDNTSLRQLFADPDFKQLFAGRSMSPEYREGDIIKLLGVTYIPTTEAYVQTPKAAESGYGTSPPRIRRPIIMGAESLIQANFEGMETWLSARGFDRNDSNIAMIDGVVQIVREPLDRLQQIVSMSWTWIGDYAVPTDVTATPTIIPTASSARYKRGVVIEHAG